MNPEEAFAPLSSHFFDLRVLLIRGLFVVAAGFVLSLCFYPQLFSLLTTPFTDLQKKSVHSGLEQTEVKVERIANHSDKPQTYLLPAATRLLHTASQEVSPGIFLLLPGEYLDMETHTPSTRLVVFSPTEGMVSTLKICFWTALVATAPLWLFFVLQFAAPALHAHERNLIAPFMAASLILMLSGAAFAFFVTIPLSNAFLWNFNAALGNNLWSMASYLDYTLFLLFANALGFEASLLLFFSVYLDLISYDFLVSHRRHAVVISLILGAFLTPPDILSQLLLAGPLLVLYESALLYARLKQKRATHSQGCM